MSVAIFDLDGVLADNSRELAQFIKTHPGGEWELWYRDRYADLPKPDYVKLAEALYSSSVDIAVITGRPESCRANTRLWLNQHVKAVTRLLMWDGFSDWHKCKHKLLQQVLAEDEVLIAIDNELHWCDMYRRAGVSTLHVYENIATIVQAG